MDKNQTAQQGNEGQQTTENQNPTLGQEGTRVADYGNVMGGSSNDTVEEGQNSSNANTERSGDNETAGNP